MVKFRKKPVTVDAMQYTGDNFRECKDFCPVLVHFSTGNESCIETLEGDMTVSVNDWIIKGVAGEFYPCKPDIFEATYEKAEE